MKWVKNMIMELRISLPVGSSTMASMGKKYIALPRTMITSGDPHELLRHGPDDVVEFLTRGKGREKG